MNILLVSAIYPEPEYLNVPKDTNAVHYFARNWAAKGHKVVALHPHINPISRIFHHLKSKYRNKIIQSDIENVQVLFGQGQLISGSPKCSVSLLPSSRVSIDSRTIFTSNFSKSFTLSTLSSPPK